MTIQIAGKMWETVGMIAWIEGEQNLLIVYVNHLSKNGILLLSGSNSFVRVAIQYVRSYFFKTEGVDLM
jgi:hypothetical protein